MGNHSSPEDAVDYCLMDVRCRGCSMWRKTCQPSSGCVSSWICFSSLRAAPCRELRVGPELERTVTTTTAWTLRLALSASAGTSSGLRQVGFSGNKVSEGLALVLSYQRCNEVLSKQVCKTMEFSYCILMSKLRPESTSHFGFTSENLWCGNANKYEVAKKTIWLIPTALTLRLSVWALHLRPFCCYPGAHPCGMS